MRMFQDFLQEALSDKYYAPEDVDDMISSIFEDVRIVRKKKVSYYNAPCAFDIETSNFYRNMEKCSCMYIWMLGLNGRVIVGRTWDQYIHVVGVLSNQLQLSEKRRLVVYVHNLSFEFQFMRKHFSWLNVFAIQTRTPIYCLSTEGIEYRCSLLLSGYSLEIVGKNLQHYKVNKKVGDLDYDLIRHYMTPMSIPEMGYCIGDVIVLMCYIMEKIETDGSITKIPLTKTGYVRRYVKKMCFDGKCKRWRYIEMMKNLTLEPEEYRQLKRAFQGGFTHCNPFYTGKTVNDVMSIDFTSSYPYVMVSEKFPMSKGELVDIKTLDELQENIENYCCIFDIDLYFVESAEVYDSYLSSAHCWNLKKPVINNGRIVSADKISTTITEQDYMIIKRMYKWQYSKIYNFRRYKKDYLPKDIIRSILKIYNDKTRLKDVPGMEVEYLGVKEMLNSIYGMCVTDIIRDTITYDSFTDTWGETEAVLSDEIEKYNNDKGRVLFYPWGVWVTAYARRNLFTGIVSFGSDYIYSDTDSIKVVKYNNHIDYVEKYNRMVGKKLMKCLSAFGLTIENTRPKNIKGEEKPLGIWNFDGHYSRFKTLGSKRYLMEYSEDPRNGCKHGETVLTVSGLNKKKALPYIKNKGDVFDMFNDGLYIEGGNTGKLTHTYIDEDVSGTLTDYTGITAEFHEMSYVHLEDTSYSLGLAEEYIEYIMGVQYE